MIETDTKPLGNDSPDFSHDHRPQTQRTPSSPTDAEKDRKGSFKSKLTTKLSGFLSRAKEEAGREERSSPLPGKEGDGCEPFDYEFTSLNGLLTNYSTVFSVILRLI